MKIPSFEQWFRASEEGQKSKAELEEAELVGRQADIRKIAEFRETQREALPAATKEVDAALRHFEKTHKAHVESANRLRRARGEVLRIDAAADIPVARLKERLREGAILEIDEFLEQLSATEEDERRNWDWKAPTHDGVRMPFQVRLDHLRSIRKQVEALRLEPDPEVARIEVERLAGEVAMPTGVAA